ncbi:MAG: hypothetical protein CVU64_02350 [Deltaproteobacteria bacterium HGW-Deltaproteobacteria-21]|nr:MAG: hypothetical protein CVU64_02350 [Deltaproteobacteria bacterium HGW-Deltaproteobacteria-21]
MGILYMIVENRAKSEVHGFVCSMKAPNPNHEIRNSKQLLMTKVDNVVKSRKYPFILSFRAKREIFRPRHNETTRFLPLVEMTGQNRHGKHGFCFCHWKIRHFEFVFGVRI